MGLRQPLLKIEPEKPAPERQDRDRNGIEMDVTGRLRLNSWSIAIRNGIRLAHVHLATVA